MAEEFQTLKDVALKAGVHPSTVSLCLNNSHLVAEKTKLRVQAIAREMGYRPHPHLKELMKNRRQGRRETGWPLLGFITFFPTPKGWRERYSALRRTIESARRKARSRGFRLKEVWIPLDSLTHETVSATLRKEGISAVLFSPLPHPKETIDWPWEESVAVAIGPSLREPRLHRVRSDHFKSMIMALEECHRLGYRRPGLALPDEVNRRMEFRWMAAYLTTMRHSPWDPPPPPFCVRDWNRETFLAWVGKERPDVILTTRHDETARWLREGGYSIPAKIGLLSLSIPSSSNRQSGILEHWDIQGERGVMLLINLLMENEFGLRESPVTSVVDVSWHPGSTLLQRAPV